MSQHKFDNCLQELMGKKEEVLKLSLQGKTEKEIANYLGIARTTIASHLLFVRNKFQKAHLLNNSNNQNGLPRDRLIDLFIQYKRKWVSNCILSERGYPSNYYFEISDSNSYIKRGLECFYHFPQTQYQLAIDLFKKAVESDPTDPISQILLNNAKAYLRGTPLKIGVVVSYSDNEFHRDATNNVLRGVADAQTTFNSHNNGRLLEIIIADDYNQPERAIEIAKLLANDPNILGVIGHHSSEGSQAALPIYKKHLLPIIAPTSTSSRLSSEVFFRTIGSTIVVANKYADYIIDDLDSKEIVVLYHKDNEYSEALRDDFEAAFKARGGKIIESNINDPQLDITTLIKIINLQTQAKAILVISSIETNSVALAIARANSRFNSSGLQVLLSTSLPEKIMLEKGGNALKGVTLVHPKLEAESNYTKKARNRWEEQEIDWRIVSSHQAAQVLIEAIKQSEAPTRSAILDRLNTIELGSNVSYSLRAIPLI